ncbi:TetR/AcrR family transcriptional regulator [Chitinophaga nivalis]|uniref:TetR/AcrR family transcriptional regulator n=1 Tax=Chitinophaga nivalis TaxID=2991709 RepID=A0ABT3IIY2_9BACT|nr:TetR/AcrR family transcriptional regulator [Chitinophaga nivalis]MCW3466396.1 TetR/AcrR family transcriptional regulator [Chitinophaga nivalis]MCW3483913.1 TetR/AcrR family transcriptional regulator [Chitinophaga nivalis]
MALTQEELLISQVLQTAQQLYQRHGIRKVTMDDVAKAIGKTRSALYYYFKNRDELFEAVLFSLVEEVKHELEGVMQAEKKLEAKIRAFCMTKIKGSEKTRNFMAAIESGMDQEERSRYSDLMSKVHLKMMEAETVLLKQVIREAVASQEIPKPTPASLDTLLFVFLSSIRGIRRESAIEGYSLQWENGVNMLARLVARELGA